MRSRIQINLSLTAAPGKSVEGTIRIKNPMYKNIILSNPVGLDLPFEIIGNPFPIELGYEEIAEFDIRYSPQDATIITSTLYFNIEPCFNVGEVEITGLPALASAELLIGNYEAFAGDKVDISIILQNQLNFDIAEITEIDVSLIYNSTVLAPQGITGTKIDEFTSKIELNNLSINNGEIARIPFIAGLGNAEISELTLNYKFSNDVIADIRIDNGKFTMLGICEEGGARLINPNSQAGVVSIQPNPTDAVIKLELNFIERGYSEVTLVNYLGETVKTIFAKELTSSEQIHQSVDLSDLPTGHYNLIYKTPTIIESHKIVIIK